MSNYYALPILTIDRANCTGTVSNYELFESQTNRMLRLDFLRDWIIGIDSIRDEDSNLYQNGSSLHFKHPYNAFKLGNSRLTLCANFAEGSGYIGRKDVFFNNVHPEIRKDLLNGWLTELKYLYDKTYMLPINSKDASRWSNYEY